MKRVVRIAIWPAALALTLLLTFAVAGRAQEKPAGPAKPAPKVVPLTAEQILEQTVLELQAENLRLRVCSDAGINWRVCDVRWRERIAVDVTTLPKPEGEAR